MKFMHLPEKYSTENALYYVLPVEYEGETTWGKGASKGPEAILAASKHLEYYDEQYEIEPYEAGIHTLPALKLEGKTPEEANKAIREAATKCAERFLLTIGGDHSVTIGVVQGLAEKQAFSVLILDAHADYLYSWNGSEYNHACVARRLVSDHKVGIVGVRSMGKEEDEEIQQHEHINIIKAHKYNREEVNELIDGLEQNVYISIDVDVFDPSFVRSTGTPEPGGLGWYDVLNILENVFAKKHVIGADIVEFSGESETEAFCMAKLAYKLLSLHAKAIHERTQQLRRQRPVM